MSRIVTLSMFQFQYKITRHMTEDQKRLRLIELALAEQNARIELMNNIDPTYGLNLQTNDLTAKLVNSSMN